MSVFIVGLSNEARNVVHQTHDAKCPCIQRQSYHPIRTLVIFQTLRKPSGDMRARLEEAEERRKAQSEAKLKVVRETTGLERHNRMRSASATRREAHYSATVEKRQKQLQGRHSVLSWDS